MQYLVPMVVAAVILVPGSLVFIAIYASYRLWKRKKIERIIKEHEEAKHSTSHMNF